MQIRCTKATHGILDVCANCCRRANQPDPVQAVQIFTSYGTFVLPGFDEHGLGEILRNICVPLSRFVDFSIMYRHLYCVGDSSSTAEPQLVWVRIHSRVTGVPVDSECTVQVLKTRLASKSLFKDQLYRLYLHGKLLQVLI